MRVLIVGLSWGRMEAVNQESGRLELRRCRIHVSFSSGFAILLLLMLMLLMLLLTRSLRAQERYAAPIHSSRPVCLDRFTNQRPARANHG